VPLLSSFSALKLELSVNNGTAPYNYSESYTTAYASSTTYKINLLFTEASGNSTWTAWVLKNGTVLAIAEAGTNLTGSVSQQMGSDLFAGYSAEILAGSQLSTFTSSQYFHSNGTSSVTLGSNTFDVTSYVANTLPLTIAGCDAIPTTMTGFNLSVGVPAGSSFELVTYAQLAASTMTDGTTTTTNTSLQVVSLTVG
jgi:hypothetical protein